MSEPCYESIKAQGCQFGFFKPDFYWNSGFFQSTWLFFIFKKFFFSRTGLALAKHCLSCILITNLFKRECMAMQGVKNTAKILLLAWKCSMYFIKNKCTTVKLRGKKMLLKLGIALYRCFWRILISVLFLFMRVLCVYVLKPLSGIFWLFVGQDLFFLVKTNWQPCQSNKHFHL